MYADRDFRDASVKNTYNTYYVSILPLQYARYARYITSKLTVKQIVKDHSERGERER
jgi:hypothetical protein